VNRLTCESQQEEYLNKRQQAMLMLRKNRDSLQKVNEDARRSPALLLPKKKQHKLEAVNCGKLLLDKACREGSYVPLAELERVKLANHLDALSEAVVDQL